MTGAANQDMLRERLLAEQEAIDKRRKQISASLQGLVMPVFKPPQPKRG